MWETEPTQNGYYWFFQYTHQILFVQGDYVYHGSLSKHKLVYKDCLQPCYWMHIPTPELPVGNKSVN